MIIGAVAHEAVLEGPAAVRLRPRWYRTPSLAGGITLLAMIVALALAAPLVSPFDPSDQDVANALASPSAEHWLGTDQLGRDVWTRLLYGARIDLQIAFLAVLFSVIIGTFLGAIAGYFGGPLDTVIMRTVDVVRAFPPLVLIIGLAFVLGSGVASIYLAIALVDWSSYARITRGEILVVKEREYVLAARAAGLSSARILSRHIMPNVITQTIVFAMSDIVLTMLAIVTLGYLGLGVPPPTPDWGSMIAEGQNFLSTHWRLSTIPGLAIVVTGLSLSLIGDGLAALLRPE
jgi:peptide/nickel transport system permease protein